MRRKTSKNIVKQYQRYTRKLNYLLSQDRKSSKIGWLRNRIRKLSLNIRSAIKNQQLRTKRIVTTAAVAVSVTAAIHSQVLELKLNDLNPFYEVVTGGQAKPHFVDFDNDGDDDLFISAYVEYLSDGIRNEGLHYYENDGGNYKRVMDIPFPDDLGVTDIKPEGDEIVIAMDFIDFDGDGDLDAFSSVYEGSGITYLENVDGTFAVNATANPFSDIVLSEDDYTDVELGDFDGDGTLEAVIIDDNLIKLYSLVDGKYVEGESLAEGEQMSPTLFDFDGDEDLDLIVGNKYGTIDVYENNAGTFTALEGHALNTLLLEYNPSAGFTDINGDGDVDVVFGLNRGSLRYFEKNGDGYDYVTYNPVNTHFYGASFPSPEFVDLDGDGDEDLLVGTEVALTRYVENTGEGFVLMPNKNPFDVESGLNITFIDPDCGDIDNDGDIDCHFMSSFDGFENYFENVDGSFEKADSLNNPILEFSSDDNKTVAFEDFDGDGDLDVFIGNKYGEVFYYENNDGMYVEKSEVVAELDYDGEFHLTFADVDNDGDNDLMVVGPYGELDYYMKSEGSLTKMEGDANPFIVFNQQLFRMGFYDFDGDGDLDILGADANMRAVYIENLTIQSSLENELYSEETKIFPNPSSNFITVDMPWADGESDVLIYSMNGQFLKKATSLSSSHKIDVADLKPGNYHLKIVNKERLAVVKFAVVR